MAKATLVDPVFGDANPTYGQDLYEEFMAIHPEFRPLYEPPPRSPIPDWFVVPTWDGVDRLMEINLEEEIEERIDREEDIVRDERPIWRRSLSRLHLMPWRLLFRGLWVVLYPPPPIAIIFAISRVLISPTRRQQLFDLLYFMLDD